MSGRPAIEEVPLQDAIASARDWNRALQQTALARQAIALQQSSGAQEVLDEPASGSNRQAETLAGAQHAQHDAKDSKSGKEGASQESQQQHSSVPAEAQRAQQGLNKANHSSAAKHAQHGDNNSGLSAAPAQAASQPSSPSPDSSASTEAGGASPPSQSSSSGTDQQTPSASASSSPSSQQASASHHPSSRLKHPSQPDGNKNQDDLSAHSADPGEQPEHQHHTPVQQPSQPQSQSQSQSGAKSQPGVKLQPHPQPESQLPVAPQQQQKPSGDQQQTQQRPSLEQQQQQQQAEVQEGQQKVHEVAAQTPGAGQVLRMPPSLPTTDDLRCVLGCGERLTMLDGLQGTLAGLAVKVLTGPGLVSCCAVLYCAVLCWLSDAPVILPELCCAVMCCAVL